MESIRTRYSAEIHGFFAKPMVEPEVPASVEGDDADESMQPDAELLAAMAEASAPSGPVASRVTLDFVVRNDGDETLPGITVDITMGNAVGEKAQWTAWIDASSVGRAGTQMTHELENVEYEEGDGFHVEVRHPIPEGERTTYREYLDAE